VTVGTGQFCHGVIVGTGQFCHGRMKHPLPLIPSLQGRGSSSISCSVRPSLSPLPPGEGRKSSPGKGTVPGRGTVFSVWRQKAGGRFLCLSLRICLNRDTGGFGDAFAVFGIGFIAIVDVPSFDLFGGVTHGAGSIVK